MVSGALIYCHCGTRCHLYHDNFYVISKLQTVTMSTKDRCRLAAALGIVIGGAIGGLVGGELLVVITFL